MSQEKEWLSPFLPSVVRSAVCNMGAFWSAFLVGCKLSGPESSMEEDLWFSKAACELVGNCPEMAREQDFCPQIKSLTFQKKGGLFLLEDSILIIACLPFRSYFLTGSELGWGRREFLTELPCVTAQKSMCVVFLGYILS